MWYYLRVFIIRGGVDNTSLLFRNTSPVDLVELDKFAEPGVVEITEPSVDLNEHGEFVTAAVVIWLSVQGLKVLATWLNKRRSQEKTTITATLRKPDGSEQEITINWSRKESEAPMPEQLKALGKLLDVKLPALPA